MASAQKVLQLRHTNQALLDGSYVPLNESDRNVLAYLRVYNDQAVLVALNMSAAEQTADLELSKRGYSQVKSLVATGKSSASKDAVRLGAYGVFIGQLSK